MAAKLDKLYFGPAGIPNSSPSRNTFDALSHVKKIGLDAMELEFVHGVNLSPGKAKMIGAEAKKHRVVLSAHAPYFINLNAKEKPKVEASVKRILDTARVAYTCGAYSMTFHAAYYLDTSKEAAYFAVRKQIATITKALDEQGIDVWVRPETTGKPTQFGDFDELVRLSSEFERVLPCIDFSHLHARNNGGFNSSEEFSKVLSKIEAAFGREGLNNLHAHVSGIAYGPKGEKHHLTLKDSDFKYKELLRSLKDFKAKGIVICESPNLESDALLLKNEFGKA